MKTLTEFAAPHVKAAAQAKKELTAGGKTAEELPAAMIEAAKGFMKITDDKIAILLQALDVVEKKLGDLKRVVVFTLAENEKTPAQAQKIGENYFLAEYFPPLSRAAPQGRGDDGFRGKGRGDRKGQRGGRGDRGGDRGRGGGGAGDRDRGQGRDRAPQHARIEAAPRPPSSGVGVVVIREGGGGAGAESGDPAKRPRRRRRRSGGGPRPDGLSRLGVAPVGPPVTARPPSITPVTVRPPAIAPAPARPPTITPVVPKVQSAPESPSPQDEKPPVAQE